MPQDFWRYNMRDRIIQKLKLAFPITLLEVIDESHKHIGHAGHVEGTESHFKIIIRSSSFDKLSLLQAHRAVYDALGNIVSELHAISIEIR